ncbi:MAG: hypothetical protein AAF471_06755, partial [Myxococcota bacterium]
AVLEDLRACKRMVCHCDPDNTRLPEGSEWRGIARPIRLFQGNQPLYYTCIAVAEVRGIDRKRLVPFGGYEQPQRATGYHEYRPR